MARSRVRVPVMPAAVLTRQADRVRAAAERRQRILYLLAAGMTRHRIAKELKISTQRLWVIIRQLPPSEREAAEAAGAGLVRCPHCGLWVGPHQAGHPTSR